MSTSSQEIARAVEALGTKAADPFIKSADAKRAEQIAISEFDLFVKALPLLELLAKKAGSGLHHIFHHANKLHHAANLPTTEQDNTAG